MKVLIVGSGGREHAIAWKISQNSKVEKIFAAPGNAYNKIIKNCENINLKTSNDILNFALKEKIDLTIVGSEELLVDGIVDKFKENNLTIFGPNRKEAEDTLNDMMTNKVFAAAGDTIVIEEFLDGVEISVLSITDSEVILPFISAKDHKKISEKEIGLNTGGMGVIAPNPYYTKTIEEKFIQNILNPTLKGIKAEKMNFAGIIFFGLMVTNGEVYLLEYNMRMGDPETQAVLPLMKSDFLDVIYSALNKDLKNIKIDWEDKSACCVVMAAGGYPVEYEKGNLISGLEKFDSNKSDTKIFFAGVKEENDKFYTNGGRVLNVVSIQDNLRKAIEVAYKNVKEISFKDNYCRKDIGTLYVPVKY